MPDETPSTPATPAASVVASAPPAQPQTVTIPLEQLQTFTSIQARLAQVEAEQRTRDDAARVEQVKLLAQKGEIENALRIQREQAEQQLNAERAQRGAIEERAKRYALDGELSRVLASQPLVPGGAEQLTQLWRGQFTVEAQADSFAVRTPTFQSVSDFVAAQLAQPHYAHFIRSTNQGGTAGTTGAHQADPTPPAHPAAPPQPKTLGEAVILHMQSIKGNTNTDPRLDLSSPMGLRRTAAK
jgi:hypothetical protein